MESTDEKIGLEMKGGYRYPHPLRELLTRPRKAVWWISNMDIYPFLLGFGWLVLAILTAGYWENYEYIVWAVWGIAILLVIWMVFATFGCFEGKRFKYIVGDKHVYLLVMLLDKETWKWITLCIVCENKPTIELSTSGVRYLKFEFDPLEKLDHEWISEFYVRVADNTKTVDDLLIPRPTARIITKGVQGCTERLLWGVVKLDQFVKGVPITSPIMTFENHPELDQFEEAGPDDIRVSS